MPNYFEAYNTIVHFIFEEELKEKTQQHATWWLCPKKWKNK